MPAMQTHSSSGMNDRGRNKTQNLLQPFFIEIWRSPEREAIVPIQRCIYVWDQYKIDSGKRQPTGAERPAGTSIHPGLCSGFALRLRRETGFQYSFLVLWIKLTAPGASCRMKKSKNKMKQYAVRQTTRPYEGFKT